MKSEMKEQELSEIVTGNTEIDKSGKSAIRRVYARWAPIYDATFGAIVKHYRRHVRTSAHAIKARDILEVGVGTGGSLHHYPRGSKVVGIDMCEEMLAKARARVSKGIEANVELRLGDGERLTFPAESFDLVVMLFVVSVTPDPKALLGEVARVLRPGGQVLIINHFAGVTGMKWIERLFAPMADSVGFHSQLDITAITNHPAFEPIQVKRLWPIGFFHLITLKRRENDISQ